MKSRVRMIVVLVCVFVVLPVVGGLVYLSRVSAEAAARYYAEAIAQGRFEDAMGMESPQLDEERGEPRFDLRRSQRREIGERRVGKECRSRWSPYH